jgi:hypothetical protein
MFNREKFFAYILDLFMKQGGKFTQGQVYRILWEMNGQNMLFHLDDLPKDVGHTTDTGEWMYTFNVYEATVLYTVQPAFFGADTLPNFAGDPHEICCQLTMTDEAYGRHRVLPRWGFSFDEHDNDNHYVGFTEPKRWNGWGCPMLPKEQVETMLNEMCDQLTWTYRDRGYDVVGKDYPDCVTRMEGEVLLDVDGNYHLVYETSGLGWCFNVGTCQEVNPADWEGYL